MTEIVLPTANRVTSRVKTSHYVGPYELLETLGRGNFGKVRRARHMKTKQEFAVKIVETTVLKQDLPGSLDIRREMSIQRALIHPNIIHLHEVMESGSKVYLVMDIATGGDFFQMISKNGRLPEVVARKYFKQLVEAVEFCHQKGVYHRDLKPENILLTESGDLKVTDFGFSAMKDHGRKLLQTNCGSPHYCAPEVWNGTQKAYDGAKTDAFSIGVILYVLLAGSQPFYDDDEDRLLRKVNRCQVKYPNWIPKDAVDLLQKLIVKDPNARWNLTMVKRHPWYLKASVDEMMNEKYWVKASTGMIRAHVEVSCEGTGNFKCNNCDKCCNSDNGPVDGMNQDLGWTGYGLYTEVEN